MSSELKIEANTSNLETIFSDFYTVPSFQREYIWQRENVETMLQDILSEFSRQSQKGNPEAEYFLGSIVVCKSEDGTAFDLIDGQQRMTTLYILVCAIRDYMLDSDYDIPQPLASAIKSSKTQRDGTVLSRYRVELQYSDGGKIIKSFGDENLETASNIDEILSENNLSNSVRNLLQAYQAIKDFLLGNFANVEEVNKFWAQLLLDVKLIRIVTPDLTQALQIFETINERGIGLNAMDLLKNLIFMNADSSLTDKIADKWKGMVDQLQKKEKPLRFLRYFILSQYDIDLDQKLTENDIYQWFRDNPKQHCINTEPIAFLDKLVKYSKAYLHFVENKDIQGTPNVYLENISMATTSTARQHFILLMAGRELEAELFDTICMHLENTLFCYLVTRQRTNVLERNIIRWAQKLRNVRTADELKQFLQDNIHKDLRTRKRNFDNNFLAISLNNMPKYRIRYTLGKIVKYIEDISGRPDYPLTTLASKRSTKSTPQIEHILPYKPT